MFVGDRMSHPVLTVHPELPIQEALNLMHTEHVRRLPVVDKRGGLVGIVTEKDLLNASPSEASTLSVWEVSYLLSKITVERIMNRNVICVSEDMPLEEAARIMADHKIGSLPVVRKNKLVGIITETDLFKIFLELLGAREGGVRLTVQVKDEPGMLYRLTGAVQTLGGNIIALGTFMGESTQSGLVTLKVSDVGLEDLKKAIEPLVEKIVDIRQVAAV